MRARIALLAAVLSFDCGGRESAGPEIDDAQAPAEDGGATLPRNDASAPPRDASFADADTAVKRDADAAYCPDYGVDTGATVTLPCAAPLSESADFDDPPITKWCFGANSAGYETSSCTCGGMLAIVVGVGPDCYREYLFDASTRTLVARLEGCVEFHCTEGPSELLLRESSCFGRPDGIMQFAHHDWPSDAGCP